MFFLCMSSMNSVDVCFQGKYRANLTPGLAHLLPACLFVMLDEERRGLLAGYASFKALTCI